MEQPPHVAADAPAGKNGPHPLAVERWEGCGYVHGGEDRHVGVRVRGRAELAGLGVDHDDVVQELAASNEALLIDCCVGGDFGYRDVDGGGENLDVAVLHAEGA